MCVDEGRHRFPATPNRVIVPIVLVVALLLTLAAASSAETTRLVLWSEGEPIAWQDFQGAAPSNARELSEVAAIHMTIKWHVRLFVQPQRESATSWLGTVDETIVSNLMNPRFSWYLPAQATPDVLHHEQLHFDLNEVYRRKLEHSLADLRVFGRTAEATLDDLDRRVRAEADSILQRLSLMQTRFDAETRHGQDTAAQANWERSIRNWLVTPLLAP